MSLRRMVAELVLDTTSEGIWLIDAQARTTFVNRHVADLLGYAAEEMIGMHVFEFMDERRRPITEENLIKSQRGVEQRHAVQLKRKDGTPIWVLGSSNPVYDRQGRYAGSLTLLGDLTDQKETERRLRARIVELRRRLLEKTLTPRSAADPPVTAAPAPSYREPFRTAIVLGICGSFVATIALVAAGSVMGSVLRSGSAITEPAEP